MIDITSKIKNETKFIKYGEKTYRVDDRKNTIIEVHAILNANKEATIATIDEVMGKLIGKDAVKDFADLNYEDYLVPFFAAMACVQGKSYEETEAAFRQSM
jgi:predicted transcriptional regulator